MYSHYGGPAFSFGGRKEDPTLKQLSQNPGPGQYSAVNLFGRSPAFHIGLKSQTKNLSATTPTSVGPGSYSYNTSTLKINAKPLPPPNSNRCADSHLF